MDLDRVRASVSAYEHDPDVTTADVARLRFFEGLLELQQGRAEELARKAPYELPAGLDFVSVYRDPRQFVLGSAPVRIDAADFAQTLASVARYVTAGAGLDEQAAHAIASLDWDAVAARADLALAGADPAAFVEAVLGAPEKLGIPAEVPGGLLGTILVSALRPHLQPAAEVIAAAYSKVEDPHGYSAPLDCPVCGSPATASWVGDAAGTSGRGRKQYCATCGTQWDFDRIRCDNCGTHNEGHLHYHSVEGDPGHRILTCDECGGYERVVFQEDLRHGPLVMEVEDVVMANLDQVARDPRFKASVTTTKATA
ncbi:formate dehydrogenase accessory protein FdhE [bacterium]|nr:formate dehydrogenase accessory protein FdhE [bacterium]